MYKNPHFLNLQDSTHDTPLVFTMYLRRIKRSRQELGGGPGGEVNQREVKRGNSSQDGSKIPTKVKVSPVYKICKNPAAEPLYRLILKKSRHLGFGVFIDIWSIVVNVQLFN